MARVAAIVVRELACEIVRQRCPGAFDLGQGRSPSGRDVMAVIVEHGDAHDEDGVVTTPPPQEIAATATLDVVSDAARRYGVRPGQKVTEATALTSGLAIHRVTTGELDAALGRIAEVALALGVTAAIRLDNRDERASRAASQRTTREPPPDTVWLDITGASHLVGGEEALAAELCDRVGALGHRARVAVSSGPRVAQAVARHHKGGASAFVVAEGGEREAMSSLPVHCLPIDPDVASFLVRVGVLLVGDLAQLPRASAAARLGPYAPLALELCAGHDDTPLLPYTPPRVLEEATCFEEPVESSEALLFVLRGMSSRIGARLAARGEATSRLEASILYDRSIARLRHTDAGEPPLGLRLAIDLPSPLSDPADLLRPLKAKLERAELLAPAVAVSLRAPQIARARRVQLDLSRNRAASPDALPALLAELSAEIGADRIGVLEEVDAHRPEKRSRLIPPAQGLSRSERRDRSERARASRPVQANSQTKSAVAASNETRRTSKHETIGPTRLLPEPVALGRIGRKSVVLVDRQLYTIEELGFVMRLDGVEWWTSSPTARDYLRAWLVSGSTAAEAWVYVDRQTGEGWLQGWSE